MKHTAVYMRVSTAQQNTRGQKADLQRWVEAQDPQTLGTVKWFTEKASGKTMDRAEWAKLEEAIHRGEVDKLVVWRLDRLGRTASGLCKLFEDLQAKKVRLISLKDSVDLGTSSGRLIAHVLASVAAYETEIRGERVRAGQEAARKAGVRWGGSERGRLLKITEPQVKAILKMKAEGETITSIAKVIGVCRISIYRILKNVEDGYLAI